MELNVESESIRETVVGKDTGRGGDGLVSSGRGEDESEGTEVETLDELKRSGTLKRDDELQVLDSRGQPSERVDAIGLDLDTSSSGVGDNVANITGHHLGGDGKTFGGVLRNENTLHAHGLNTANHGEVVGGDITHEDILIGDCESETSHVHLKGGGVGDGGVDLDEDTLAIGIITREGEFLDLDVTEAIESYDRGGQMREREGGREKEGRKNERVEIRGTRQTRRVNHCIPLTVISLLKVRPLTV